jgi:lipopolysaccharide export system protein LptA
VRVDGPDGTIRSSQAEYNLAKGSMDFQGDVQGSSPQIRTFAADTLSYGVRSGDTEMTNLRAQGLAIASGTGAGPGYSSMDIEKAPRVSMAAGHLNSLRDGVDITLRAADPNQQPLRLHAHEFEFQYAGQPAALTQVTLQGGVHVNGPGTEIKADTGDLDWQSNALTFTGNVSGNTPEMSNFVASKLVYNLKTGDISTEGLRAEEFEHSDQTKGKPTAP